MFPISSSLPKSNAVEYDESEVAKRPSAEVNVSLRVNKVCPDEVNVVAPDDDVVQPEIKRKERRQSRAARHTGSCLQQMFEREVTATVNVIPNYCSDSPGDEDDSADHGNLHAPMSNSKWKSHLDELKAFHSKYGHYQVKQQYDGGDYKFLCGWIGRQRLEYEKFKSGKKCLLDEERVILLESLADGWLQRAERGTTTKQSSSRRETIVNLVEPDTDSTEEAKLGQSSNELKALEESWLLNAALIKELTAAERKLAKAEHTIMDLRNRVMCPVCHEDKDHVLVSTKCGHRVCFDCYFKIGNKCASCRMAVNSKVMKRLYN
jgi:hypothetical protein